MPQNQQRRSPEQANLISTSNLPQHNFPSQKSAGAYLFPTATMNSSGGVTFQPNIPGNMSSFKGNHTGTMTQMQAHQVQKQQQDIQQQGRQEAQAQQMQQNLVQGIQRPPTSSASGLKRSVPQTNTDIMNNTARLSTSSSPATQQVTKKPKPNSHELLQNQTHLHLYNKLIQAQKSGGSLVASPIFGQLHVPNA